MRSLTDLFRRCATRMLHLTAESATTAERLRTAWVEEDRTPTIALRRKLPNRSRWHGFEPCEARAPFEIVRLQADHAPQRVVKSEPRSTSARAAPSAVSICFTLVLAVTVGLGALGQEFVGGDILFGLAVGTRRSGMGGAGVALPSVEALFTNPAGLPWIEGVQIRSTYGSVFDAAHLGVVSVSVSGVGASGIILDAGDISPGLAFRTAGAVLGVGVRLGPVGVGARARFLLPVAPVPGLGGALDLALLWRGPIHVGVVWRNVAAQAPVPSESWPTELEVGLALPVHGQGLIAAVALDLTGVGSDPAFAIGAEFGLDWLLIRAGYGARGVAFGGSVGWSTWDLDWAILLHSVLPPAVHVSFTVRL